MCDICLQNLFQGKCMSSSLSVTASGGFFDVQILELSFIPASCRYLSKFVTELQKFYSKSVSTYKTLKMVMWP